MIYICGGSKWHGIVVFFREKKKKKKLKGDKLR